MEYRRGVLSIAELNGEIAAFWGELREVGPCEADVRAYGVDPDELLAVEPAIAVRFSATGAGLDPSAVAIAVAFAPSVNHALQSLWDTVVLAWIRSRRGEDAVGPETKAVESGTQEER